MKRKTASVILLVLCSCILAYMLLTESKDNSSEAVEISAEDLWSEFVSDKKAASARFEGNRVIVTGSVAEIAEAFMGRPCILLENGVVSIPDGIFCLFPQEFDVTAYNIGDVVTISGRCSVGIHIAGEDVPFIFIKEASVE